MKKHLIGEVIFINEGICKRAGYIHKAACGYSDNYLWPVTPKYSQKNAIYYDLQNIHLVTCNSCKRNTNLL